MNRWIAWATPLAKNRREQVRVARMYVFQMAHKQIQRLTSKYFRYLHKTNTAVLTILPTITRAKFHLSRVIIG